MKKVIEFFRHILCVGVMTFDDKGVFFMESCGIKRYTDGRVEYPKSHK